MQSTDAPTGHRQPTLRETVEALLVIYGKAWVTQDPELILQVFTPDATYHERVLHAPMTGHGEIKKYWEEKVVKSQANIKFTLLKLYVDEAANTAIAEWAAEFDDLEKKERKCMKEVAILELRGDRIASLREYWASKPLAPL